jgi:exopolyphosphatase/guanosine-5'-triphosphate,3'-diphosphate pyrophosphatase
MKLAVFDLGSTSFHLAVYQVGPGGLARIDRVKEMVRFGRTLASRTIDDVTWDRGLAAIGRLLARAGAHAPQIYVAAATSAIREADNGEGFCRDVERHHGLPVDILSGEEEARLAFRGAASALGGLPPAAMRTVIDLGGGSVELAVGDADRCALACTLPLGAIRLRDDLVPADGYVSERTAEAIARAVRATASISAAAVRGLAPSVAALTSGTARAVAALANELGDRAADAPVLTVHALRRLVVILSKFRPTDLASLGVEEGRTDTLATASVVLLTIYELLGLESARVVDRGLREGLVLRELDRVTAARRPGSSLRSPRAPLP